MVPRRSVAHAQEKYKQIFGGYAREKPNRFSLAYILYPLRRTIVRGIPPVVGTHP